MGNLVLQESAHSESTDLGMGWVENKTDSAVESGPVSGVPPRRPRVATRAAVVGLTSLALAGLTVPGLRMDDPFGQSSSSSVREWEAGVDEEPASLSWADVVAASTKEFLAIEAKRAALADREAELYAAYDFDDED